MEGAMFFFSTFDNDDTLNEGICFGIGEYQSQKQEQEVEAKGESE